jgi:hypothetical protein
MVTRGKKDSSESYGKMDLAVERGLGEDIL